MSEYLAVVGTPDVVSLRKGYWKTDAGKMVGDVLKLVGIDPASVDVVFAVDEVQPMKSQPSTEAIRTHQSRLLAEIAKAKPRKILSIGATPLKALFGTLKGGIEKTRGLGLWFNHPELGPIYTVPTFDPMYVLRDDAIWRDMAGDIQKWATNDAPKPLPKVKRITPRTVGQAIDHLRALANASALGFDLETTGFDPYADDAEIFSFGFGAMAEDGTGISVIIPLELVRQPHMKRYLRRYLIEVTKGKVKVLHNAKFDLQWLWRYFEEEIEILYDDTMLNAYCMDERSKALGLKTISRVRYDIPDYHFDFDLFVERFRLGERLRKGEKLEELDPKEAKSLARKGITPLTTSDWDEMYDYHSLDCYNTIKLWWELRDELPTENPRSLQFIADYLLPGCTALARVEAAGVLIDQDHLHKLRRKYEELTEIWKETKLDPFVAKHGGVVTNYRSAPQLVKFFNDNLRIPMENTEKEALLFLTTKVDPETKAWIETLIEYRLYKAAISTYVDGLLRELDPRGYLHADFDELGARTGRLSCRRPNLQNIPTLMGPDIRLAFIVPDGYVWVDADESQLELRIAGFLSQDEAIIQAYRDKRDLHREVAAAMFNKAPAEITDYERYLAKYVDFGVIYQRGAHALATGWEMTYASLKYGTTPWTVDEAQVFIDNFLGGFPGLQKWIEGQKAAVRRDQYVETFTGHRRRYPYLTRRNVGAAERQAVNTPIQGLASHVTFSALTRLTNAYKKFDGGAKVLMTVHDSIGNQVHKDLVGEVTKIIHDCMETPPFPMNVPLKADVKVGPSWGLAEKE